MSSPNVPYPQRPPYRSPYLTPRRKPVNPWLIRLPLLAVTGVVLFVLVMLMLVAGYQFLHRDEIFPGVSTVFDLNLAGMTREEATAALSQQFSYGDDAAFTFRYGDRAWTYSAAELGVSLDVDATVDAAYNAGRTGGTFGNLFEQIDIWTNGYPVAPVVRFDETQAYMTLYEVAQSYVNRPVLDATITVSDAKAVANEGQVGRQIDLTTTLAALRHEILALSTASEITLAVNETPPLVWDVSAATDEINTVLATPVKLFVTGDNADLGPWTLDTADLEKMLVVEQVSNEDGTVAYDVSLNLDDARALLEEISPDLSQQPVNARFVFDDEAKQLDVLEPSIDGRVLDVEGTLSKLEAAIFATDPAERRAELVFVDLPPDVPDTATAAELGITELITQHTTYYYGSSGARRTNIEVANENFHGIVIAPGGTFSFNEWLGDVSPETGYEQGLIIVGNQTITGVGGGVCQVATTAFQTAFYAGFPIVERVPHAYRVGYYEQGEGAGLDATVYSPIVDFRFQNDTPYYLLIEAYNNPGSSTVTWKFYSTSMDRRVEKDGPYITDQTAPPPPVYNVNPNLRLGQINQVDGSVYGADVTVYRTVYEGDTVIRDREEFQSHYVPWATQYEVAPNDPRVSG
ncbi:VanW family protein [Aggregatilinea lenta]|uniref:VanW family protein n=1 Tax=Aggregatilinea lenta TaxID=913108 RepID=UPI000E5B883E|nr:VanW family protein [Aggregatilinea lenta]